MRALLPLKFRLGAYLLQRAGRRSKRGKVKTLPLDRAARVGLLFDASDAETCVRVNAYARKLREEGIRTVRILGWVSAKEKPDYLPVTQGFGYFGPEDVSWTGKPASEAVSEFVQEPFDVLIDLDQQELVPLMHLLHETKANLKAGPDRPGKRPFLDFMIQVQDDKLDRLIAGLDQYLRTLTPIEHV